MKSGLTQRDIENRMLKDLFIGAIAVILFGCAVYFLHFLEALAECTGRIELARIDTSLLVAIYIVWLFGIFALRRSQELQGAIAERGRIEKRVYETQKVESLARMATGIAHDFNNLLSAIKGFCDIAINNIDAGRPARDDLVEIRRAGDRADSLIRHLLCFARKKPEETKVLDVNEVISNMRPLLQHLVGVNVHVETELQPVLSRVRTDITQIEGVLVNLALNAHDAMPDGGKLVIGTSDITFDRLGDCEALNLRPGNYVKLSVTDTGSGIDPKIRNHIFEPFFSTKEKGTGLGLSMVSGIAKQNRGAIEVDSEIGRGTEFVIYLPAVTESNNREKEAIGGG